MNSDSHDEDSSKKRRRLRFMWSLLVAAAVVGVIAGINQAVANPHRNYFANGSAYMNVWDNGTKNKVSFFNDSEPTHDFEINGTLWVWGTNGAMFLNSSPVCTSTNGLCSSGAGDNNYTIACSAWVSGSNNVFSCSRSGAANFTWSVPDANSGSGGGNISIYNGTANWPAKFNASNTSVLEPFRLVCDYANGYAVGTVENNSVCFLTFTQGAADLLYYPLASNPAGYITSATANTTSNINTNVIPKWNGSRLINSSFIDNGTDVTTSENILPQSNGTQNLGSNASRWADLWLKNSTVYLGTGKLQESNGNLVWNGSQVNNQPTNNTNDMRNAVNNTGVYNISISCSNITGAASNLCTITSSGSSPNVNTSNFNSSVSGTQVNLTLTLTNGTNFNVSVTPDNATWNQVLANSLYLGISGVAVNAHQLDGNGSGYYSIKAQTDQLAGNLSNQSINVTNGTIVYNSSNNIAIGLLGTGNIQINQSVGTQGTNWTIGLATSNTYTNGTGITLSGTTFSLYTPYLDSLYLGLNAVAANSHQLDGNLSTYYSIKSQTDTYAQNFSNQTGTIACSAGTHATNISLTNSGLSGNCTTDIDTNDTSSLSSILTNVSNLLTWNGTTNVRVDTLNSTLNGVYSNVSSLQTFRDAIYTNTSAIAQFNGTVTAVNVSNGTIVNNNTVQAAISVLGGTNIGVTQSGNALTINNLITTGDGLTIVNNNIFENDTYYGNKNITGGRLNITSGSLYVNGNITFQNLLNCNTALETNSSGGIFCGTDPAGGAGNVTGTGMNGTSGNHLIQTSNTDIRVSNLSETTTKLYYPFSLLLDDEGSGVFGFIMNATSNMVGINLSAQPTSTLDVTGNISASTGLVTPRILVNGSDVIVSLRNFISGYNFATNYTYANGTVKQTDMPLQIKSNERIEPMDADLQGQASTQALTAIVNMTMHGYTLIVPTGEFINGTNMTFYRATAGATATLNAAIYNCTNGNQLTTLPIMRTACKNTQLLYNLSGANGLNPVAANFVTAYNSTGWVLYPGIYQVVYFVNYTGAGATTLRVSGNGANLDNESEWKCTSALGVYPPTSVAGNTFPATLENCTKTASAGFGIFTAVWS